MSIRSATCLTLKWPLLWLHSGSNKRSRKDLLDAYAAMLLLRHYFDSGGEQAQLVLPKKTVLQERLFALSDELRLRGHDDWEDES